ncbi:abdominal ganglion neuropeptides L5-67 [Biomphalaria pfeifferi]|uniref:Abdominal ganglion neuropeptides L5-67 n=1 Tax=Biomphalaria pfeifferi TaxID=112525 RepID=A0AAD8BER7_BIOPF|nr:abdominal ganglion neuropeptides L5-67 [Biomphalaria pfeifferi]
MKTSQIILSCCCVLAAVLTVCYSKPQWRPQGRFGKRTDLSSTTDTDKRSPWRPQGRFGKRTLADEYSVPFFHTREIPVEILFTTKDLENPAFRPVLCTVTAVSGYPVCETALVETRDTDAILDF